MTSLDKIIRFFQDLSPDSKAKQRALAEDYFMCLLELKVLYEESYSNNRQNRENLIRSKMSQITSDPNWRPKKWNFHTGLYK